MGLETDFYKLTNGMTPKITPPVTRSFSPPSLLWLAPALAADLMGKLGGNEFRDNQLAKIGKGYDPNTGLSKPYFGGQSLDKISEQAAPPFTGGQSANVGYYYTYKWTQTDDRDGSVYFNRVESAGQHTGAIVSYRAINLKNGDPVNGIAIVHTSGAGIQVTGHGFQSLNTTNTISDFVVTRMDGFADTGGNIPMPTTTRDGDTTTKGDDNPTDRVRKAGGSPPPVFRPNGTSTTTTNNSTSNTTNNISNNATTNNNTTNNTTTSNTTSISPSTTVNNFNFSGDVNKNFSPAPPTTQPFTPPIVKPSIAPDPKPDKKEEEKKVPPPFIPPTIDPATGLILGAIASATATTTGLLNQINAQTSPENQRTNSKNGSCDALQEPSCREGLKNDIVNPLGNKLDANAIANDVALKGIAANQFNQNGLLAGIIAKLDAAKTFSEKVAKAAKLDKIYNLLTFITVVHNAQMLSNSLATTLMDSLSLGLATIGIKDENESPIDIQSIINKSVEDTVKGIIGTANYTTLSTGWKGAVRVYQAGANIAYQVRSLWDSARSLQELTGANVGKIGNALRRDGAVSENAYTAMADNPLMVNSAMTRLQNLEEAASHLNSITSEAYSVTETVTQIKKDQDDFKKLVKESQPLLSIPNDAAKAKDDAAKLVSVSPSISNIDLVKP